MTKLIHGDLFEHMPLIQDNSIDCIITSPPYNLGGDFHICNKGKDGVRHRVTYGAYDNHEDKTDEDKYQANQVQFLDLCYHKLNNNGVMFYNHKQRIVKGKIIHPLGWINKSKFIISQIIILDFSATANVDKRRFFPVHEYLFILKKDPDVKLNNIECLTDIWKMKKVPRKTSGHPATFHVDLPLRCLRAVQNCKLVLDPYMGTGTVGEACNVLGIDFIGIEQSLQYFKLTENRLSTITEGTK